MKIVSRISNSQTDLENLKQLVEIISADAAPDTTAECITKLEILFTALSDRIDVLSSDCDKIAADNRRLSYQMTAYEQQFEGVLEDHHNGVAADLALDEASLDLMNSMSDMGAGYVNNNGQLNFYSDVVFESSDFKCPLKEAIHTWLKLKLK
jgi:hypothetical protein